MCEFRKRPIEATVTYSSHQKNTEVFIKVLHLLEPKRQTAGSGWERIREDTIAVTGLKEESADSGKVQQVHLQKRTKITFEVSTHEPRGSLKLYPRDQDN